MKKAPCFCKTLCVLTRRKGVATAGLEKEIGRTSRMPTSVIFDDTIIAHLNLSFTIIFPHCRKFFDCSFSNSIWMGFSVVMFLLNVPP